MLNRHPERASLQKWNHTERILGDERFGDTTGTSTVLVLCPDPEDVLLLLNEFGHMVMAFSQRGSDRAPADLQLGVVLFLQSVVEDLAAAVIQRRIPLANHGVLPHLLESEVHWRPRSVCARTRCF